MATEASYPVFMIQTSVGMEAWFIGPESYTLARVWQAIRAESGLMLTANRPQRAGAETYLTVIAPAHVVSVTLVGRVPE